MADVKQSSLSKKRKRNNSDYKEIGRGDGATHLITKSDSGASSAQAPASIESSEKSVFKRQERRSKRKTKSPVPVPEEQLTGVRTYLTSYATERSAWKFSKQKQNWLLRHFYDTQRIPAEWETELMVYLSGLPEGAARERVIEEAKKIVSPMVEKYKTDNSISRRAKQVLEVVGAKMVTNERNSSDNASDTSSQSDSDVESITSHASESSSGSSTSSDSSDSSTSGSSTSSTTS
ncbi:hypothetical protein POJ06DRAFT_254176 [Lipomyces tetrasporus]|uniref:WKF domain-containing protein n=1 Tax=Lipomyces tetrasporus TaxID=54092 RepID=A0AAD7VRX2_9ASCO|nr:uncharacterized protein POJ06DRAFT_254176 [Lipomyces tetrasporus]KAJ8099668.1 hypothetical protein POJ06DRAFT_254176 [Lipomyces tetrasporus]